MALYGNFNINKKKKGKKIIIAAICIVSCAAAAVFAVGIIAGSRSGKTDTISSAVEENTQLKIQINELNDKIVKMQETIDSLKESLDARPTIAPSPAASAPVSSPSATRDAISPREGI